jgi:hypothetical protein
MKAFALILAGLLVWAPLAGADNIGTFMGAMATAQSTGKGQTTVGGTLGIADVTTYVGSLGYGFSDKMDGRIRIGAGDESGFDTAFVLGGDLRWQLMDAEGMTTGKAKPFDLALGGFMEWSKWSFSYSDQFFTASTDMKIFEVGMQVTGSKTYHMSNGSTLTPYGRFNIRNENAKFTYEDPQFGSSSASDSQIAAGLNAGVAWGVSDQIMLMGELQIDGNDGLFLGIDYRP